MKTLYQIIREFYGENKEDYKQVVYTETVYESKQDAESVLLDGMKVKLAEQGWEFRITEVNLFEERKTADVLKKELIEGIESLHKVASREVSALQSDCKMYLEFIKNHCDVDAVIDELLEEV